MSFLEELSLSDETELHSAILDLVYHIYSEGIDETTGQFEVVSNF